MISKYRPLGLLSMALLTAASLSADELALTQESEGGLIHTKQKGRYESVRVLPERAESFDAAFVYAKPFATFRIANVTTSEAGLLEYGIDAESRYGTSVGGKFGLDTASLYGLHLHIGVYVSQAIQGLNPDDPNRQNLELFNSSGGSYTYIGEANIRYENSILEAKAGRISIETPFADSDDNRMSPNSFEGVWGQTDLDSDWQIELYYLTRWAGTDSGDDPELFKPLVSGGYGLSGASLSYRLDENNGLSLWYYNIDKESDIIYAEAVGEWKFNERFHMEWGLQGAHIIERDGSGIEGDVLGAMVIADLHLVYFGLSYNHVFERDGKTITDGFGGGPYFTSLDEQTIGAVSALSPGDDLYVYRLAAGVDLSSAGLSGFNAEVVHGNFNLDASPAVAIETDVVITYTITERWYFDMTFADVDIRYMDYTDSGNRELRDFQRLVIRLDYSF